MTAIPSPHRLRTKTSDIADFFRASSSKSRATDVDGPPSPTLLSDPEFSLVPKRSSKIPFLGRQRTKSIQSDASTSASSAGSSRRPADSDVRRSNVSSRTELRLDVPAVPSLDDTLERPLPALPGTPTPPLTSASPSLGSKLAARFAPSRQKFLNLSPRKAPRPSNDDASDTLVSSATPSRGTSVDSTATGHRSTTPRPTHPTITVSLPPDNLEGYEGMFTLPTPTSSAPIDDPQLTPTSPTPPIRFPDADTTVKRRSSRAATAERSSSRASRISRKHVGTTFKRTEVDSTDAEDSEAVMSDSPKPSPPMNAGPTPTAEKRRTLATMPYNYSSEKAPPRSIMKSTSERFHRPPGFPPPPPPTSPPSSALPVLPSRTSNGSPPLGSSVSSRQRAHTFSTVPSAPITAPSSTSLQSTFPRRTTKSIGEGTASPPPGKRSVEEPSGKENFDMERASAEQLRQQLTLRNQQFDELASYLLKLTDAHIAEKQSLLKKIANLEQEAARRENEIKGLTWLVTNNTRPGSSGSIGLSDMASKSTSALDLMQAPGKVSSSSTANPAEDSGAESYQTTSGAEDSHRNSGPESMRSSGISGAESSTSGQAKKVKRSHTLMSSFYRTSVKNARPESKPTIPSALPYRASPGTKRASISSLGSSPSSSTSSLSLSTVTPATTVTSLGAIPEAAATTSRSKDPVVAAAILATENQRAKEERRASRVSNRLSGSSVTAPSASAAYSANLKRTRPPSIAQVLSQSPKIGRDKLRFTSGSASS